MTRVLLIVVPPLAGAAVLIACDLLDDWLARRKCRRMVALIDGMDSSRRRDTL